MSEYQFEDYGVLAEERYHVEECDKEEYGRIFKFKPALKLIASKNKFTEVFLEAEFEYLE
jgi:hypothetical protein